MGFRGGTFLSIFVQGNFGILDWGLPLAFGVTGGVLEICRGFIYRFRIGR